MVRFSFPFIHRSISLHFFLRCAIKSWNLTSRCLRLTPIQFILPLAHNLERLRWEKTPKRNALHRNEEEEEKESKWKSWINPMQYIHPLWFCHTNDRVSFLLLIGIKVPLCIFTPISFFNIALWSLSCMFI